jgi:hypothetical protein
MPINSEDSVPPGRTNSHEMLIETPVGAGMPCVERAREVTVSVSWRRVRRRRAGAVCWTHGEENTAVHCLQRC